MTLKQRWTRLLVAIAFAAAVAVGAAPILSAQRIVIDQTMTCVYYTETSGLCWETINYADGGFEHHTWWFWGNWYGRIT
jgi:hypothetical protein